jgi:hypothetical protein
VLEREITSQNGIISKNLPENVHWLRIADSMKSSQHAKPFDGILFIKNFCWPLEVKIGSSKLTEGEIKYAEKCRKYNTEYIVLRYYDKYNAWSVEIYGSDVTMEYIKLKDCLDWIIYRN